MTTETIWRKCGSCKKNIHTRENYYYCAISTCRKNAFCSMSCFDDHVPVFRHKDAWAEEKRAPAVVEEPLESKPAETLRRVVSASPKNHEEIPKEVLVVASKLKDYIRKKSGFNTSQNVMNRLSDMVRVQCDKAIERANSDNRKTVMDRDFFN